MPEKPILKPPLVVTHPASKSSTLEKGSYALVVSATNELHLYLPATADEDAVFPKLALALIAVANRLQDRDWVDQLLVEEFGPDSDPPYLKCCSEIKRSK